MYETGEVLLSVQDVNLEFQGNKVLRDINIEVKDIIGKGQVKTILGRSGVGKTQLFRMIAGLIKPTSGRILVGANMQKVEAGVVGMVLQTYPLFAHRTVMSNLKLVCSDQKRIDEYLNEFDIWDHKDKYPSQLSGGQRQRTAIVQQMLCSDHFVVLDEPFSGLDPVATDKLCKNITKMVQTHEHNTVLISSHVLEPSIAISDGVWIIGHEYIENFTNDGLEEPHRKKVDGAKILYEIDLAAQGLAWQPEIRKDMRFVQMMEEIRDTFHKI